MRELSAAEFKRRFMNKAAVQRAKSAVQTRVGTSAMGTAADRNRLNSSCEKAEPNPGYGAKSYHKPQNLNTPALRRNRAQSHIVFSY